METKIVSAKEGIEEGARIIKEDGLVVFPTETVYGLGANALSEEAVKKIFTAKGRPQDNPLIVHISSIEQVKDLAVDIPDAFYMLADKYMPGPLTVILKKSDKVPYVVTAGGETVGIRMPKNVYTRELISKSFPLAAPSANKSKHISPTTAQHVFEDLQGELELILDDGPCMVGIESTVLDLTCDTPTILRPGAVTAEMLSEDLGEVLQNGKVIKIAKAPGMKYTHYAPKVPCVMSASAEKSVEEYDIKEKEGLNPVIVTRDIFRDVIKERNIISLGITAEDYTRNIYSALHEAEKKYGYIIVEKLTGAGIEASVMNRVEKACGGKEV
ncbi:MAG: threonylcarbamoyl-AMP synthase [Clostridia bacterium]|nr:threonylcarbamoyl-AMP synthase [Clostridia bacterium]